MKHLIPILALLALSVPAFSQARTTVCNANTPNDALCVTWVAPATMVDGSPTVLALNYRLEQKLGATGTWATVQTGLTVTRAYITGLAPGLYYFRVFANCTGCSGESAASNEASKAATAPPVVPNPPTITIAVLISPDAPPTVVQVNGQDVYASVKP